MSPKTAEQMLADLGSVPDEKLDGNVNPNADAGHFNDADQLITEEISVEAVPPGVVDEQAEIFERAEGASGKEDGTEQSDDGKSVDEGDTDWKRVAGGRLNEIGDLRAKMSEQSQNIENLRQMWLADAKQKAAERAAQNRVAELKREEELYGPEVVNDPTARYMRDKVAQTQDMIERNRQADEARQRATQEQSQQYAAQQAAQQQSMAALETMEASLAAEKPDYPEAYKWAIDRRTKMYEQRGYGPQEAETAVRNEEAYLFAEQMQRGGNPAKIAYDLAVEWGWKPEMSQAVQQQQQQQVAPDYSKMRAGLQSGGVAQMGGNAQQTHQGGQSITAKQFFETVPEAVRISVLSDPNKFEELGRTGKIRVDW